MSKKDKIAKIRNLIEIKPTLTDNEIKMLLNSPCADYKDGKVHRVFNLNNPETPSPEVQAILNCYRYSCDKIEFNLNTP